VIPGIDTNLVVRALCACVLLASGIVAVSQVKPKADLIITNARVWTVDPRQPRAEAVAILGEHIVALGTASEIDRWRGDTTQVIDARGHLLLPGFNDAHLHFTPGGLSLDALNLRDSATPAEFARRIAERAAITPAGEWITGGAWDDQVWVHESAQKSAPNAGSHDELPTRQLIDAATRNIPVLVERLDGHMALANSAALKIIGITRNTPDPPGGEIVRDPNGEPTGILKDAAMAPAYAKIPPISHERRLKAVRRAMAHAARIGITSVQDMNPSYEDVAVYAELAERGELTVRIYAAPPIAVWEDQAKLGLRHAFGSHWLRYGAVKAYADGSLGSTTAYMFAPYRDAPQSHGLLREDMLPPEKIRRNLLGADRANLQLCTHAIGDRAVSTVLDLYAEVEKQDGPRDRRFRIEHAQHVAPKDFARFRDLGVIASMQPYHAIDDGRWAETRISHQLASTSYAWRTMLDNHVHIAFGTDWPVAPLEPLTSLYAAVTRATLDGKYPHGWFPEQKLTVAEAIEAYTLGSAYAEFQEKEKGSITAGKLADVILLSDDVFVIEPKAIQDVTVELTVVGGRVVYQSGHPAKPQPH
jgi:predicted amidohydrolase YtcJ